MSQSAEDIRRARAEEIRLAADRFGDHEELIGEGSRCTANRIIKIVRMRGKGRVVRLQLRRKG